MESSVDPFVMVRGMMVKRTVGGKKVWVFYDGGTESGLKGDSLKVIEENSNLLKEIIIQLKINNYILNEVHDLNVTEKDIRK